MKDFIKNKFGEQAVSLIEEIFQWEKLQIEMEKLFRSRKVNVSKEQFPMKLIEFFNKFTLYPSEYFGKKYLRERQGYGKLLRIKVYVDGKETNDPNTMINKTSKIIIEEQIAMRKERTVIGKRAKV
ncbi:unnamed protein product, partial [marine sediment metagenome]